eukprot:PhF_6_TR6253/c0_g1_i1/m.9460
MATGSGCSTYRSKHFGMDERGLGGRHMIQQQFLALSQNVHSVHKMIDNTPPLAMHWGRRVTSDTFVPYYKRVPSRQALSLGHDKVIFGKTDTSPPKTFHMIARMYINKDAGKTKSGTPQIMMSPAKKPRKDRTPSVLLGMKDIPELSRVELLEPVHSIETREARQREIQEHLENLRYRRWVRQQRMASDGTALQNSDIPMKAEMNPELVSIAEQALEAMKLGQGVPEGLPVTQLPIHPIPPPPLVQSAPGTTNTGATPTPRPPTSAAPLPPTIKYNPVTAFSSPHPGDPDENKWKSGSGRNPAMPPRPHSARVTSSRKNSCTISM